MGSRGAPSPVCASVMGAVYARRSAPCLIVFGMPSCTLLTPARRRPQTRAKATSDPRESDLAGDRGEMDGGVADGLGVLEQRGFGRVLPGHPAAAVRSQGVDIDRDEV